MKITTSDNKRRLTIAAHELHSVDGIEAVGQNWLTNTWDVIRSAPNLIKQKTNSSNALKQEITSIQQALQAIDGIAQSVALVAKNRWVKPALRKRLNDLAPVVQQAQADLNAGLQTNQTELERFKVRGNQPLNFQYDQPQSKYPTPEEIAARTKKPTAPEAAPAAGTETVANPEKTAVPAQAAAPQAPQAPADDQLVANLIEQANKLAPELKQKLIAALQGSEIPQVPNVGEAIKETAPQVPVATSETKDEIRLTSDTIPTMHHVHAGHH